MINVETPQTIRSLLSLGREKLEEAGIVQAQQEAEWILMKLLNKSRSLIYLEEGTPLEEKIQNEFYEVIRKRQERIPLAYLLNEACFWQETLYINEDCLVPRPETEILVESFLKEIGSRKEESFSFLDLGTGSGAIGVAILRTCQKAHATLVDISKKALEVAQINLKRYALEKRARLITSDLWSALDKNEKWDMVISNPPYLSLDDWAGAEPEVRLEPQEALIGGDDGLNFYKRIIRESPQHLKRGGMLALEVGIRQAEPVCEWLRLQGYVKIHVAKDYQGIHRAITAYLG